jgi:hypothetical protein
MVATAIGDEDYQSDVLVALAPHLDPFQRAEVLRVTTATGDEEARSRVLVALAPHVAVADQAKLVIALMDAVSDGRRPTALLATKVGTGAWWAVSGV